MITKRSFSLSSSSVFSLKNFLLYIILSQLIFSCSRISRMGDTYSAYSNLQSGDYQLIADPQGNGYFSYDLFTSGGVDNYYVINTLKYHLQERNYCNGGFQLISSSANPIEGREDLYINIIYGRCT